MTTTVSNIDRANLNALDPNLATGQVANPALRKACFDEIYNYFDTFVTAYNAFVSTGGIGTNNLADLSVTMAKLALLAVGTGQIADSSVTSAKIADNTIVDTDISGSAAIAWSKISKTSSSLLDLATRSASDLSSGTLNASRLPTAIPATNIGNGDVTNAILSFLNTLTSNAQTQLDAKIPLTQRGAGNGVATLDSGAKVPIAQLPDAVLGALEYQSTWNASTNTPTLPNPATAKGYYYVVTTAGTQFSLSYNIGDWAISNGVIWDKVDNTDAVPTVFGRTGNILAATNDYAWAQINKTTSSLVDLTTRSASDLSSGTLNVARLPTGIPAINIAGGVVDDAEFQFLNGVTSAIQPQITARANEIGTLSNLTTADKSNLVNAVIEVDTRLKNIEYNVKRYGASGSEQATTGSITSGLNVLTLASALDFVNGQGINVYGKYEVASLLVTAGATSSANCTVTLNGVAQTVALTNGNTATQVATAIRAAAFAGWATGGSGTTVTFTSNRTGLKTGATYSAGTTGATGTMTTTTQGTTDLITTITSGAGTTTLVLASNASTTVSGVVVTHDDTIAIQAAIDAALTTGGDVIFPDSGVYLITTQLSVKPSVAITALTGSNLHFSLNRQVNLYSKSGARIKSMAVMTNMILVQNNSALTTLAPYYFNMQGLTLDGNNLAVNGLNLLNCFHAHIERNRIYQTTTTGIYIDSSVVSQILYNVVKGLNCIYIYTGGDHTIAHNDLFPITNGKGIYMGGFTGDTVIENNIVSCEENDGTTYGIYMDGTTVFTGPADGLIGNVTIRSNEFSATNVGIVAFGKSTHKTVYNVIISENHIATPFTTGVVKLFFLQYCYDFDIHDNLANALANSDIDSMGFISDCDHMMIHGNKIVNTQRIGLDLVNATDCMVYNNDFYNYGKTGAGWTGVYIRGTSLRNEVKRNRFKQDTTGYATTAVIEIDTSDYNIAEDNTMGNQVFGYTYVGANTVMRRKEYAISIPVTGVGYNNGDQAIMRTPISGGNIGWVLTASGWKAFGTIA